MNAFNKIEEGNPIKCSREVSSKIAGRVLSIEKTIEEKKGQVNCVCSFHNENYRHSHQSVAQIRNTDSYIEPCQGPWTFTLMITHMGISITRQESFKSSLVKVIK